MRFTSKYNICKCFSCGVSYDIFDLIGIDYHLDNFKEKINKLEEIYLDKKPIYKEYVQVDNSKKDYTYYYNKCSKNIDKSNYLENREITKELIKKYNIGFNEKTNFIVFPINQHCYFARSTVDDTKIKNPGSSDIWNKELLNQNDIIYVTEGIIDSLSLEVIDPSIKTISINGAGNIPSFLYTLKDKKFEGIIVIAFDNDERGIKESKHLKQELDRMNIKSISIILPPLDCKDINDALMKNKGGLEKNYNYVNNIVKKINLDTNQEKNNEKDFMQTLVL